VARQRYAALCNGMAKRKRRERKVTLASVAKQANKAGIAVARYEIEPDGKIIVVTGKPDDDNSINPWLAELDKVTKQ
jgi:hypothetical protein